MYFSAKKGPITAWCSEVLKMGPKCSVNMCVCVCVEQFAFCQHFHPAGSRSFRLACRVHFYRRSGSNSPHSAPHSDTLQLTPWKRLRFPIRPKTRTPSPRALSSSVLPDRSEFRITAQGLRQAVHQPFFGVLFSLTPPKHTHTHSIIFPRKI